MGFLTFLHLLGDPLCESEAVCHHLHRAEPHLHLHPGPESLGAGDHQHRGHDHYNLTLLNTALG